MTCPSRRSASGGGASPAIVLAIALLVPLMSACIGNGSAKNRRPGVIILGFDGMDYHLTHKLMDAGRLPNFARLAERGSFGPLQTSIPPQSPVAWSDFITGTNAGGHGIFDFVHRDPSTMIPYLSTTRVEGPRHTLSLGSWRLPMGGGRVELLRRGEAFWEALGRHGVPTTIYRIPANFPPSGTASRELSGMGTPDVLGTYGTFSFYTTNPYPYMGRELSGGEVYEVTEHDGVIRTDLHGPANPYRKGTPEATSALTVFLDPDAPAAKLDVGGQVILLREGEWSGWIPIAFPLAPTQTVHAICRVFLRRVRPDLELYVTPFNLDPRRPAMPISSPAGFARDLAEGTGLFYTQGMPEDTKALTSGVFTLDEFLAQARMASAEVLRQLGPALDRFRGGLLFYYFGDGDQVSHMVWRSMDPGHPAYDAARDAPYADVVPRIYEEFDRVVGETASRMPQGTLLVAMSDHGFTSWRRAVSLNAWLRQQGYLVASGDAGRDPGMLARVDWRSTVLYGLGLNGLYVNLRGREKDGIVPPARRDALLREVTERLLALRDPKTGAQVVRAVYRREEVYGATPEAAVGPDLVIGYADTYRCSNDSAAGGVPDDVFRDNTSWWSGDHCMDPQVVPGVLLSSRPLRQPARRLQDLAAAIMVELGDDEPFPPRK